uniref:DUF3967 domain-containing protein n=1 Tax=Bacillus multifaciens TaxID=3068506 RepID=UPI003F491F5B
MSDMEIIYTAKEVYSRLEVSDSTLRKYVEILQRESYTIKKNKQDKREYTEHDVMVIEKLIELSKHDGMTLEKAAKLIMQKLENFKQNDYSEEVTEADLIPYPLQQQFQEQYNAILEKLNQEQKQNLLEMEQRLGERIERGNKQIEEGMKEQKEREERIEKRLEQRDENLMKVIREVQEAKRTIVSAQEEVAAARLKKKSWWKFWE